jgi:DNA-binding transcriptional LysR family regulator
MSHW